MRPRPLSVPDSLLDSVAKLRSLSFCARSDSGGEPAILPLMPSANVELVRSIWAAWERGDYGSAEWAHPQIEFVIVDGPAPGSWVGPASMAEAFRDFLSAWEEYRAEVDEYRELDDECVLVLTHRSARGKTSGLELAQMRAQGAGLFHVRDGKVMRLVVYFDRQRALADLGLASETDSSRS
jgi:ketosteroid isomerase-like protein